MAFQRGSFLTIAIFTFLGSGFSSRLPKSTDILEMAFSQNCTSGPILNYTITQQWNSRPPPDNTTVDIKLYSAKGDCEGTSNSSSGLVIEVSAKFYNDPIVPPEWPVGSTDGLWDYEVVEVFFLSESEKIYLETEFAPLGHYLLLELDTNRTILKYELPLENYKTVVDREAGTWQGKAIIPWEYVPKEVNKFNAYAIHKSDPERVYMSLFPTPDGEYEQPNFHRLEYFQPIDLSEIRN